MSEIVRETVHSPNVFDSQAGVRGLTSLRENSMIALLLSIAFAQDQCPDTEKTEPGYCGCAYEDIDVNSDSVADSCVHFDAQVDPAATLGVNVTVNLSLIHI